MIVSDTGYVVVMKIPFKHITPETDAQIGFDAQINDGKGGERVGIAKWCDASDNSWENPSAWGVLTLLAP